MNIIGIDYSMSGPSICVHPYEAKFEFKKCQIHFMTNTLKYTGKLRDNVTGYLFPEYKHQMERFENIADWAMGIIGDGDVLIEDYSMGSRGRVFHIAENTGLLKYKMWKNGVKFETVAPTVVKKFGSGKGNSDKTKMHAAFLSQTGIDLQDELTPNIAVGKGPVTDIIDSYFICMMNHSLHKIK